MNIDKTIISTLLILCLIVAIPSILFYRKMPVAELLPSEKVFINFSTAYVSVTETKKQPVFSGLDCPVKAPAKQPVMITKSVPYVAAVPKLLPTALPRVSLIYFECDSTKRAIIGGQIVQVGSTFENYQVMRIERTKVLVRSAGKDIWLNML